MNLIGCLHLYWFRRVADSLLSTLSTKSKCINASRRAAFYFVKFRGREKFPVISGHGKQYYQVLTNYTLSEKNVFLHSFHRRHLWNLAHASWKVNALFLSESAEWNDLRTPVPSSFYTYYLSIIHGASYYIHYFIMCSQCVVWWWCGGGVVVVWWSCGGGVVVWWCIMLIRKVVDWLTGWGDGRRQPLGDALGRSRKLRQFFNYWRSRLRSLATWWCVREKS